MTLLSDDGIARELLELPGWTRDGNAIRRQFSFAGFPDAVAFVSRLVPACEAADHHPDVTINYRKVTLSYSTHSEGGVTLKDFSGAKAAEAVAGV